MNHQGDVKMSAPEIQMTGIVRAGRAGHGRASVRQAMANRESETLRAKLPNAICSLDHDAALAASTGDRRGPR